MPQTPNATKPWFLCGRENLKSFNSSILLNSFAVYTDGECEGKVFLHLRKLWLMLKCNCLPFCFASSTSSSSSTTTSPSASERHSCDHLSSWNYYRSEESVLSISATFSIWIQWCGAQQMILRGSKTCLDSLLSY